MTVSIERTASQEQRELERLKKELNKLETDLVQHELDLNTLSAELKALDLLYIRKVGIQLIKLDLIDARIAEILAKLNPDDRAAEKRAQEARKHADEKTEEVKTAQAAPEEETQFKPSESLRALYREAAKRIHPDLACDEDDRELRTRWMVEINAAYQAGNEARLQKLFEDWENSPESVQGTGTNADLERMIRKVARAKERLQEIQKDMERLRNSFAYTLKMRIRAAKKDGRDLLEDMAQKVTKQVERKQTLLDDLLKNSPPISGIDW